MRSLLFEKRSKNFSQLACWLRIPALKAQANRLVQPISSLLKFLKIENKKSIVIVMH